MIFVKIFIILFTPMHQTFVFLFERYMYIFTIMGLKFTVFFVLFEPCVRLHSFS